MVVSAIGQGIDKKTRQPVSNLVNLMWRDDTERMQERQNVSVNLLYRADGSDVYETPSSSEAFSDN